MKQNPFVNAIGAASYIILVVTVMTVVTRPLRDKPDSFLAPITVLFVLTLSVAVMAYLFFYQPLLLLIDGKKKEALRLFAQTVGIFAVITSFIVVLLSAGAI